MKLVGVLNIISFTTYISITAYDIINNCYVNLWAGPDTHIGTYFYSEINCNIYIYLFIIIRLRAFDNLSIVPCTYININAHTHIHTRV